MTRCILLAGRAAFALAAASAPLAAAAQDGLAHPLRGPYLIAAVGGSEYDHDCFVFGLCQTGKATSYKVGAGYRFGVTSVEAWGFDFGSAHLGGDDFNPPSKIRMRALGVGAAWTARFGDSFEFTWRVGGAEVRHEGANAPTADSFQPYFGIAGGLRVTEFAAIELGFDFLRGRDGDSLYTHATAASLGLRFRF
jgi:hypothetical protein